MNQEVWDHIESKARQYSFDDAKLFLFEYDWEPDWMLDIMDDPDAEIISTNDRIAINYVLLNAFERAHGRTLSYWEFRNLLYN